MTHTAISAVAAPPPFLAVVGCTFHITFALVRLAGSCRKQVQHGEYDDVSGVA